MKHPTIIIAAFLCGISILHTLAAPARNSDAEEIYDQRQNGTENYRINVDGLFLAIAPAETIMEAASSSDLEDLLSATDLQEIAALLAQPDNSTKPSSSSQSPEKPIEAISPKTKKSGLKLKLGHLLLPLLKRNNHQ